MASRQSALASYYETMVEAMDTEIGRLLRDVDLATTTVFFIGDNGTPGGVTASPYPSSRAKATPYEGGVRVPLLVAGAGVVTPGRVVARIVSAVDLYPTILELAGIDLATAVPAGTRIDGVSIVPYLRDQTGTPLRRYVYSEKFPLCWDRSYQRAIANSRYKLIRRADGSRAFYDLGSDPYETTDLLARTLTTTQRSNLDTLTGQMSNLLATGDGPCEPVTAGGGGT
jgi:arylsulfatase A-like enzyme